ncbi:hypothetical protein GCM10010294_31760 [Streptomyces griseoloalbus]|nr:hypothetical protein GCM10010294_31760 [Streptomyces griseoloalbus]
MRASLVTHVDSTRVKSLRFSLVVWSIAGPDGLETWAPGGGNFHGVKPEPGSGCAPGGPAGTQVTCGSGPSGPQADLALRNLEREGLVSRTVHATVEPKAE